jgi:hypothetical protein
MVTAGGLLAACGGSSGAAPAATPSTSAAVGAKHRGGNLRVGLTGSNGADTQDRTRDSLH